MDIITECKKACGENVTELVVRTAAAFEDEKAWCDGAERLAFVLPSREGMRYLAIITFTHLVQVDVVHECDRATLGWLSDLYSKLRLQDDQMNNLPFRIGPDTTKAACMGYLWAHLRVVGQTLRELSALYAAGYVHLLSRAEAAAFCQRIGDYVLRLSNRDPGTMVVTTVNNHIYLNGNRGPAYQVVRKDVRAGAHTLPAFIWTLPEIKKLLRTFNLHTCRFGTAIPLEGVNAIYQQAVHLQYQNYREQAAQLYSSPPPPYPQE